MNENENKRPKTGLIILLVVMAIIAGGVGFGVSKVKQLNSEVVSLDEKRGEPQQEIAFTVEKGASVRAIAAALQEKGVIDWDTQFIYLCKKMGRGADFQPGEYTLNNYMSFSEICDALESGRVDSEQIKVTIPEGLWLKEIAQIIEDSGLCTAEEFIEAANSRDYDYDFVNNIPDRDNLLEGYLFPDTYYFSSDMTAKDIVNRMLARFDEIFDISLQGGARMQGVTVDEAVIMASLIESEARYGEDRTKISSVIYNRIKAGMKIQMDASVLYALGERKDRVLYEDLEIEEPHNTYYVDGLPIGPIGNPGKACLEAAVTPADTNYIYYVVEDTATGEHYFTDNYNDFLNASSRYKAGLNG